MKKILLFLVFGIFISLKTSAVTWYTNINASGLNNGTSWADAFIDLQAAIAASAFGDEIWVAAGTYKPTTTTSRTISFTIKNGTKVYGGFVGNETLVSERDFNLNLTTLSGEIATGSATDNSYKVVYFTNVGVGTEINGFRVMLGYNNSGNGAGILSLNSSATIKNCKIIGNYAEIGGGLSHGGSGNITIQNCLFEGNICITQGGAINIFVGTNNTISNCYIKSNQSNSTGGIICMAASSSTALTVSNTVMSGNTSNSSGIYFNSSSLLNLYNCLIVGNYSTTTGVIRTETASSSKNNKIVNCTIAHNNQGISTGTANTSVALNSQSSVTNSIIYGNNSLSQILGTGVSMSNCIMQSGTSSASGTNVISVNPNFELPSMFSSAPFDTTGFNYRLKALSQGINYGLNANVIGATDLDGNVRIQNTTVDAGAFESNFCASAITLSQGAPYTICGGTPITLSINGGVDHIWSTGSTNSSIPVSSAGTYSVVFEDTLGCRGSLQAIVTSSSNPAPTISFSGGNLNIGTFANYQWSFNGTPIVGATSNSHVPIEGYGMYSISVGNSSGCIGNSSYCLSPAALNTSGPTSFCQGGSVTLNATGGTAYVWSNGQLTPSITVSTSGNYNVTVQSDVAGCAVNLVQVVTVNTLPSPIITLTSGNLSTGVFSQYQWSYNGTPISGANSQSLTPTSGDGQYSVSVTNSSGCTGVSTFYNYYLGIEENDLLGFSSFPNPLEEDGILYFSKQKNEISGLVNIAIYDLTGAEVAKFQTNGLPEFIELKNLKAGVYFLNIQTNDVILKGLKFSKI